MNSNWGQCKNCYFYTDPKYPENWPMLREALQKMGRADLIGNGKKHLIPTWQPAGTGGQGEGRRVSSKAKRPQQKGKTFRTQHVRKSSSSTSRKRS